MTLKELLKKLDAFDYAALNVCLIIVVCLIKATAVFCKERIKKELEELVIKLK